jgi:RNA polymerase sigma factor (sigma-70 family)
MENNTPRRIIPLKLIAAFLDELKAIVEQELHKKGDQWKSQTRSDVFNSVFVKFWKSKGEEGAITDAEFRTAVKNHLTDKHNKRTAIKRPQSDPSVTTDDVADLVPDERTFSLPSEFKDALDLALEDDDETPSMAEVFRLRFIEGHTVEETAQILGSSVETVKRRTRKLAALLRFNMDK